MKKKQALPNSLSGAVPGTSEVLAKPDAVATAPLDVILHSSENIPITVKKSDVELILAEQLTRVTFKDGTELFVRETPQSINRQLNPQIQ